MLHHLHIQNFTIISELELELKSGMTVLTGETGAGKSILLDALLLALGERAEVSVIRPDADRCVITAMFAIQTLPAAQEWLAEHDLASDDECLLRRVLTRDGRSKAFINNQTVPLQALRELGQLLVNIHGQHEHQTLLKPDKQRLLLDAYAAHDSLCVEVRDLYWQWRQTQEKLSELQTQHQQRAARQELLTYQAQELDKLSLQTNELAELDREQRQLANAGHLLESCQNALSLLVENEESNVLVLLNTIHHQLSAIQTIDNQLTAPTELVNNAIIQVQEAVNELQHYLNKTELNPERLHFVEQRLTAIYDMARKHKIPPEKLVEYHQQMRDELAQLEGSDAQIQVLQQQLITLKEAYQTTAKKLTKNREKTVKQLVPAIEKTIRELGMPQGQLMIKLEKLPEEQLSPHGLEKVEFLVSTNPGQSLQSLAKIVSGGELSRISLAIQVLTAQKEGTPTLIFDEVDTGIGGGTAEIVGRLLRTLGNNAQVLCVTHLPQVAALAHHHFQVSKKIDKKTTETAIQILDTDLKIHEIARMLGGVKITEQTLAHAKEMLVNA